MDKLSVKEYQNPFEDKEMKKENKKREEDNKRRKEEINPFEDGESQKR